MNGKIIAGVLLVVGGAFQVFLLIGGALQSAVTDYYISNPSGFRIYYELRIPTMLTFLIAGIFLLIENTGERASKASGGFLVGNVAANTIVILTTWLRISTGSTSSMPLYFVLWMLVPACIAVFGILLGRSETGKVKKAGVAFLFYTCLEAVSMLILLLEENPVDSYFLNQIVSTCWAGAHAFLFIGAILLIRIDR